MDIPRALSRAETLPDEAASRKMFQERAALLQGMSGQRISKEKRIMSTVNTLPRAAGFLALALLAPLAGCLEASGTPDAVASFGDDDMPGAAVVAASTGDPNTPQDGPLPNPVLEWVSYPTSPVVLNHPATFQLRAYNMISSLDYRIQVIYGDGTREWVQFVHGSTSGSATFYHTYLATGDYLVTPYLYEDFFGDGHWAIVASAPVVPIRVSISGSKNVVEEIQPEPYAGPY
jgi:hypothetical protein